MNEFWIALLVFVVLGLTPFTYASIANRRQRAADEAERTSR